MSELNASMEVDEHNDPKEQDQNNNIVSVWLKKFESNSLTELDFRNYWNIFVPCFFKPKGQDIFLDWSQDEQKAQQILFNTLEEFMFNKKCIDVLHDLTQQNYPPSVCGRVFKMGDLTYNCRECRMDPTCVLCVDCFRRSPHKNHKYKMGASYGGGCCDCGNEEAWKKDPYCQIHKLGLEKKHIDLNFLTNDMEKRAHLVFQYVLRYTHAILTFEHSPILPVELNSNEMVNNLNNIYTNQEDSFCTVIYNDETCTINDLSAILSSFIEYPVRDIINYVTCVNREGRGVIICADLIQCNTLKEDIEILINSHDYEPLRIDVVHSHVIAHQIYAIKLLTWMKNLLEYSKKLRTVFCDVLLASSPTEGCIIESLLLKMTKLWKSARLIWHNLFIVGMFQEYENKKEFSKVFTKNYGAIMNDFINDKHHSYSAVTFSVQIFTVPTLANYLMAHHGVLHKLLNTFLSACFNYIDQNGKFEFRKKTSIIPFKRALYILGDICFILGCVPETWNHELRASFCYAVSLVLKIFNYMQYINKVKRQVGQPIGIEPVWEIAFNIHLKLKPLVTKILLWCRSDRIVFKRIYRMTVKKIWDNPILDSSRPTVVRELLDYRVTCIDYNVSMEPVSIHYPISRFLGGLNLYLDHYGLSFGHCRLRKSKQFPEQIIEPVLRTQVLISQVRAGIWKRNGKSILNQISMYYNSNYCRDMLDNDIIILQMGASLIDSSEFLIHMLNKFDLIKWTQPDFELNLLNRKKDESIRQIISLVEDFLNLIINIVGERYTPGVGKVTIDDCIKKEVIQQLCVKPMPHSELKNTLLNIIKDEECLEKVINEVAEFKKTRGKGVYELKPIYYDDYNVFFYHYSREEMSKSEEEQRKRKNTAGDLDCCPPPSLPLFSDAYAKTAHLLQSDIMLYIMKLILDRTVNLEFKCFSESQLHKVLHLIGYALHEQEKQQSPSFTFIECSKPYGIEAAIEKLKRSPRVEATKDLVTWTLQKFRQVAGPRTNPVTTDVVENTEDVKCNHLELEKQKRAKKAADRRLAVMAHFTQMQNNFMKDNAIFFENNNNDNIMLFENTAIDPESPNDSTSMDILKNISEQPVALGPHQTTPIIFNNKYTCILCQEEQLVTYDSQAMVLATFVQKSSVLCQLRSDLDNITERFTDQYYLPANFGPSPHISTCGHVMHVTCWQKYSDMIVTKEHQFLLSHVLRFDVNKKVYLCPLCKVICNTVIPLLPHVSSFTKAKSIKIVETLTFEYWLDGLNMALKQSKDVKTAEKLTSEPVVVIVPQITSTEPLELERCHNPIKRESSLKPDTNISQLALLKDFNEIQLNEEDDKKSLPPSNQFSIGTDDFIMQMLIVDNSLPKVVPKVSVYKDSELSISLVDTILKFTRSTYSVGIGYSYPHPHNNLVPLLTWKACAYTIHSNEVILRYTNKPLLGELTFRQKACLEALVHVSGILGSTWKKEHEINLHAIRLLSITLDNGGNNSIGILDWDAFGMLVALTMTLPSLYYTEVPMPAPNGTMLDFHTLILMFIANLVQIILTIDIKEDSEEMNPEGAEDTFCLTYLIHKLRGINIKNTVVVWCLIRKCALPFLRCCCLFYHYLTGIPASDVLTEVGGDTYHNMCCYLGLPTTCKALLDKPYVKVLINKWAENEKLIKIRKGEKIQFRDWTHINELVQLPEDYSELLDTVSMFTCPISGFDNSKYPSMCLVCGKMFCSQSYCCQTHVNRISAGACTGHAHSCGCGVGIFLRIRECQVLVLETFNEGCFILAPYLDEYGETDQGLKRGNPLYLCNDQYRKLQILWLSHGLYETISRYLHSQDELIITQWNNM